MDVKCLKCKKTTENTYAIQCTKCSKWGHIKCFGITKPMLNAYEAEFKNPNGKRWSCQQCGNAAEGCVKRPSVGAPTDTPNNGEGKREFTLKDIMEKYTTLLEKYEEQTRINQHFKTEIEQLKLTIKVLEDVKPEAEIVANTTEAIKEMNDREH